MHVDDAIAVDPCCDVRCVTSTLREQTQRFAVATSLSIASGIGRRLVADVTNNILAQLRATRTLVRALERTTGLTDCGALKAACDRCTRLVADALAVCEVTAGRERLHREHVRLLLFSHSLCASVFGTEADDQVAASRRCAHCGFCVLPAMMSRAVFVATGSVCPTL